MPPRNFYSGTTLDRAAEYRKRADWLAERLGGGARLVPYWRGKHLVAGPREAPAPVFVPAHAGWWRDLSPPEPVFLGLEGEEAYFALDLSALEEPAGHPELAALGVFVDLRTLAPVIPAPVAGMFAYTRAMLHWHDRHRFCGVCGSPTRPEEGGHSRRCADPACNSQHFPRTDPAVIMLVHDGERCLLGRSTRLPPGFYSTLAGFVEPGETLEQAVAREVFEEAGVRVADVRYHSSQPWPFPASLMLGFHARAVSTDIRLEQDEMEDARWFDRAYLKSFEPSEAFRLPPPDSIARTLIDEWIEGRV
ncbi:MAG TPA: NAD(+) diphosphatase [Azospirillaceae bacterium]|nr:NAD(+) diphosphatase [Azospirillaceae bacterium]